MFLYELQFCVLFMFIKLFWTLSGLHRNRTCFWYVLKLCILFMSNYSEHSQVYVKHINLSAVLCTMHVQLFWTLQGLSKILNQQPIHLSRCLVMISAHLYVGVCVTLCNKTSQYTWTKFIMPLFICAFLVWPLYWGTKTHTWKFCLLMVLKGRFVNYVFKCFWIITFF